MKLCISEACFAHLCTLSVYSEEHSSPELQSSRTAALLCDCTSLYDVHDPEKRLAALTEVAKQQLDAHLVPAGEEDPEVPEESDHESDLDEDELDLSLPIPEGSRRSARERTPAKTAGYMLNSQHIVMTEDSEA
jgi:hypothetical protein